MYLFAIVFTVDEPAAAK